MSYRRKPTEKKELNYDEAKEKALRLLEFRAHSEKELRDKLKIAGAKEEDIETVLDFCREYGFVNDRQFAKMKARDLKNLKKYGLQRIKSELYQKGISAEYVEEAVSEIDEDEAETLLPLCGEKAQRKF